MKPNQERIALLNQGIIETKNLMDGLAIDFHLLSKATFPNITMQAFPPKTGMVKRMQLSAQAFYDQLGFAAFSALAKHSSDTIRGIACYILALHQLPLEEKFNLIKSLADDHHFGVREWAWLALRPEIIATPLEALMLLNPWTQDPSANIRRFASEITRPRGVWCGHIKLLKQEPWLAHPLLEKLNNDPAIYVQLSVGNWLNDASKDHPAWVTQLCASWEAKSDSSNTKKICKRALRNLNKK